MAKMKKEVLEQMLERILKDAEDLVEGMDQESLQQAIELIAREGFFTKKEDAIVTQLCNEGKSADDIAMELLVRGEGNKTTIMIRLRMLMLGLSEHFPEKTVA